MGRPRASAGVSKSKLKAVLQTYDKQSAIKKWLGELADRGKKAKASGKKLSAGQRKVIHTEALQLRKQIVSMPTSVETHELERHSMALQESLDKAEVGMQSAARERASLLRHLEV